MMHRLRFRLQAKVQISAKVGVKPQKGPPPPLSGQPPPCHGVGWVGAKSFDCQH